jgi:glc operon protein GlcG
MILSTVHNRKCPHPKVRTSRHEAFLLFLKFLLFRFQSPLLRPFLPPGGHMKRSRILVTACIVSILTLPPFAVDAQLATKKALTLETAKKLASVAEVEALKNKWTMVIAIVDDGGNLVYLERMDNTQIGSIEVAIQKAKTAISFKRPTKAYEDLVAQGKTDILGVPGVIPIEGGLPLVVDGQYIGAIGVSGGTRQQDGVVAKAAVDAFPAH